MAAREHRRTIRREVRQATEELLGQLGQTPNAVADSLVSYGIGGVPNRNTEYVLARYLQLLAGAEPTVGPVRFTTASSGSAWGGSGLHSRSTFPRHFGRSSRRSMPGAI